MSNIDASKPAYMQKPPGREKSNSDAGNASKDSCAPPTPPPSEAVPAVGESEHNADASGNHQQPKVPRKKPSAPRQTKKLRDLKFPRHMREATPALFLHGKQMTADERQRKFGYCWDKSGQPFKEYKQKFKQLDEDKAEALLKGKGASGRPSPTQGASNPGVSSAPAPHSSASARPWKGKVPVCTNHRDCPASADGVSRIGALEERVGEQDRALAQLREAGARQDASISERVEAGFRPIAARQKEMVDGAVREAVDARLVRVLDEVREAIRTAVRDNRRPPQHQHGGGGWKRPGPPGRPPPPRHRGPDPPSGPRATRSPLPFPDRYRSGRVGRRRRGAWAG